MSVRNPKEDLLQELQTLKNIPDINEDLLVRLEEAVQESIIRVKELEAN